jgi:hypothetical protein
MTMNKGVFLILFILFTFQNSYAQCDSMGWNTFATADGPINRMIDFDSGNGPELIAAGQFTHINGVAANSIARWDGQQWHALGLGLQAASGGTAAISVIAVASFEGVANLLVGGWFALAGGLPALNVARWDGTTWHGMTFAYGAIQDRINGFVQFDLGNGPVLWAYGNYFGLVNGHAQQIGAARWTGSVWQYVPTAVGASIEDVGVFDDGSGLRLFAQGTFSGLFGPNASPIATWDGQHWTTLPLSPLMSGANRIGVIDWESMRGVYVGTLRLSGLPSIARWDGSRWTLLPETANRWVKITAITVLDPLGPAPQLYVSDANDGHDEFDFVRRWNGSALSVMGHEFRGSYGSGLHARNEAGLPVLYLTGNASLLPQLPDRIMRFAPADDRSTDINLNRLSDVCEIKTQMSGDCNGNGIPDECDAPFAYQLENSLTGQEWGAADGGDYLWMNQFTVRAHAQVITHIAVPFANFAPQNILYELAIYRDPNNDGDPNDAVLLSRVSTLSTYNAEDNISRCARIRIPPTFVGNVGDSFFVAAKNSSPPMQGAWGQATQAYPNSPAIHRSWQRLDNTGLIDMTNPAGGANLIHPVNRNWILRAISMDCNANGVWDACDISSGTSPDLNRNGVPDECDGTCAADVASPRDGMVGIDDLLAIIGSWGQCAVPCATDVTLDGEVNMDDMLTVLTGWGPCR